MTDERDALEAARREIAGLKGDVRAAEAAYERCDQQRAEASRAADHWFRFAASLLIQVGSPLGKYRQELELYSRNGERTATEAANAAFMAENVVDVELPLSGVSTSERPGCDGTEDGP